MSENNNKGMDSAFAITKTAKQRLGKQAADSVMPADFTIPQIDISQETFRQVIVDRDENVYMGHPTTVLLDDNKTMFAVYPKGHGVGQWTLKKSTDAGLTWSDRLPVPFGWNTMINLPAIYKLYDKEGKRRLFVFGGGFPAYSSMSEDDGETWRDITPLGAYGFESTINSIIELGKGEYIGFFHDNGMFYKPGNRLMEVWHAGEGDDVRTKAIWRARTEDGGWNAGRRYGSVPVHERAEDDWKMIHAFPCNGPHPDKAWDVFSIKTTDGGLTWSEPKHLLHDARAQYMEPGSIKSPDGKQILMMLRSESRGYNSFAMVSNDNGETWSEPMEMPPSVSGHRHYLKYLPDGRIFMTFRDMAFNSETQGDWIGWFGTYDDLINRREGQYRIRIMESETHDCGYAGIEILPDSTIVTTSYGRFTPGKPNYVVSVRFKPEEMDAKYAEVMKGKEE